MSPKDMSGTEVEPHFSLPIRQVTVMLVVIALVAGGGWLILPRVMAVVVSNPFLNGLIFTVFLIGILACFWQVWQLWSSARWINVFVSADTAHAGRPPRLLAPLAALLRSRGARMQMAASSSRSILESVATRIEEARDITRYLVNLLIFLGLLGTFYGLATTVPAVVETIRSLAPQEGEATVDVFSRLMTGLEAQLGGMGTAFGSSLLGLAGSLVVGLLELFASHGQNRFYRELEEWLSSITRVGFSDAEGGGEQSAVAAILDHMSDQMEAMRQMFTEADVNRALVEEKLSTVADAVMGLTQRLETPDAAQTRALDRLAEGQERLLEFFENRELEGSEAGDAESRMRLRSIDVQLLRIFEEMAAGRQESVAELRTDLHALTREMRRLRPREVTVSGERRS
tara:strand:+ start:391 stop:1590 length:1200 start_codon:yes stop_codon:yes gene_type:complete